MFTESTAFASTNDETAQHDLGHAHRVYDSTYGWRTYRYYKVVDVAVTAGMVACFSSTIGCVTADIAGGTSLGMAGGVAIGSITVNYHGWFVAGHGDRCLLNTDGGVAAAGVALISHSVNGEADDMEAGEEDHVFAVSTAADDASDQVVAILTKGC